MGRPGGVMPTPKRKKKRQPSPVLAPTLPRVPSIPKLPTKKARKHAKHNDESITTSPDTSYDASMQTSSATLGTQARDSLGSSDGDSTEIGFQTAREESKDSIATLSSSLNVADKQEQNIVVCVRVKPTTKAQSNPWHCDDISRSIRLSAQHPLLKNKGSKHVQEGYSFQFDTIVKPHESTASLYHQSIADVIRSCMQGFNSTVFVYGQTGSGKTHTMMGTESEAGVIHKSIEEVFSHIESDTSRQYLLRVAYLEIYNETLKDLLATSSSPCNDLLRIREDSKGKIFVDNSTEETVATPADILSALHRGEQQRRVGATDWNTRSSRSHCVFTITIESSSLNGVKEARISQLNLIDLAGSEKISTSVSAGINERNVEGSHINKSLLALTTVIGKLTVPGPKGHIPYRDSKLTRLLQPSLGGNARIAVICTISADPQQASESLSTLRFARNAKLVVTNARQGIVVGDQSALISRYEAEIESLKKKLHTKSAEIAGVGEENVHLNSKRAEVEEEEAKVEVLRQEQIRIQSELQHLTKMLLTSRSVVQTISPGPPRKYSDVLGLGSPARRALESPRSISNQLDSIRHQSSEQIFSIKASLEEKTKALSLIRHDLDLSQARNAELEEELRLSHERKFQLEEACKEPQIILGRSQVLQSRADAHKQVTLDEFHRMQQKYQNLHRSHSTLQETYAATIRIMKGVESSRNEADARISKLEASLRQAELHSTEQDEKLQAKVTSLQEALLKNDAQNAEIEQLQTEVERRQYHENRLSDALQESQNQIRDRDLRLFELEQEVDRLREARKPALPSVAYGSLTANDLTTKLQAIQKPTAHAFVNAKNQNAEDELRAENQQLLIKIAQHKDAIAMLQRDLALWHESMKQYREIIQDIKGDISLPPVPASYAISTNSAAKRHAPSTKSHNLDSPGHDHTPSKLAHFHQLSVDSPSPSRSLRRKTIEHDLAQLENAKPVERTKSQLLTPRKMQDKQKRVLSGMSNRTQSAFDQNIFE